MEKKKKRIIFIACLLLLLLCVIVIVLIYKDKDIKSPEEISKENTPMYNKEETLSQEDAQTEENDMAVEDNTSPENTESSASDGATVAAQPPVKDTPSESSVSSETKQHIHKWEKTTIMKHHEPILIKEARTEEIPVYEDVAYEACGLCKIDITDNASEHMKGHMLKGENASRYTAYEKRQTGTETVEHAAEYTEAWDEPAEIETCECGATR